MLKVKLSFDFEQKVEKLDGDFFDRAIECLRVMRCMHNQGINPESIMRTT